MKGNIDENWRPIDGELVAGRWLERVDLIS
jgi:hypothetical protein